MTSRSFLALSFALLLPTISLAQKSTQDSLPYSGYRWAAAFGSSPSGPEPSRPTPIPSNLTVRQAARLTLASKYGIRVRLSNALSTGSLTLSDIHIARWAGSASKPTSAIVAGTDVKVTFGYGQTSITIPPNGEVLSDTIPMQSPAGADVALSFYVPAGNTTAITQHELGNTNVYYVIGDHSSATTLTNPSFYQSRPILTGIDVAVTDTTATIVTLGDSITDGYYSTVDGDTRWPDDFWRRLDTKYGSEVGVVNAGIAGNGLINPLIGQNAIARLDRDVLTIAGVKYLVLFEGVNDIGNVSGLTAAQLIAGYRAIIARAHNLNIYVYGATITPFGGSSYYTAAHEQLRQQLNKFIRTGGAFDGVIDFDKAIADPNSPTHILHAYNSDNLHPNVAGYQAMANSIDLTLFNPDTH